MKAKNVGTHFSQPPKDLQGSKQSQNVEGITTITDGIMQLSTKLSTLSLIISITP